MISCDRRFEERYLRRALKRTRGHIGRTARLTGLSRYTARLTLAVATPDAALAPRASHAVSRRKLGRRRRRARDEAGKNDAVDMALCVARFSRKWNQLGVKKRR